jgi:hypothetical protein
LARLRQAVIPSERSELRNPIVPTARKNRPGEPQKASAGFIVDISERAGIMFGLIDAFPTG